MISQPEINRNGYHVFQVTEANNPSLRDALTAFISQNVEDVLPGFTLREDPLNQTAIDVQLRSSKPTIFVRVDTQSEGRVKCVWFAISMRSDQASLRNQAWII